MLQRLTSIVLFAGATACAKFSGEDPPPADGGGGSDAATSSCAGRTTFQVSPDLPQWATATTIKSARLGGDHRWYVAVKDNAGSHIETAPEPPRSDLSKLVGIAEKGSEDEQATLSGDLLVLAFQSTRGSGEDAIWIARRAARDAMFETPSHLLVGELATTVQDPYFAGNTLYVASNLTNGDRAIFHVDLAGTPLRGTQVTSSPGVSDHPIVSADELELFFVLKPPGADEGSIVLAQRRTTQEPFGAPTPIALPGTNAHPTWISADGCDLWVVDSNDKLQKMTRRR